MNRGPQTFGAGFNGANTEGNASTPSNTIYYGNKQDLPKFGTPIQSQMSNQIFHNGQHLNMNAGYIMSDFVDNKYIPGSFDILQRGNLPSIKVKQNEVKYEYFTKEEIIQGSSK
ncbi:hypothetical protein TVAG_351550 [Trichomonas vaginalis G3]|uniref:Uncharacterized protein n=1 Tax=Trichomonas vaginalis (strain ATCC PRA-98 / G3) TaxID=412133 RepID=A2DZN9_TRIV3|nr:hypothetical protein TVAGG3_0261090 [Trichomonas vaginalis G3]EAY14107.1 hypothetical protein TVAG_351550 [Trichomonas vaginalis G3]KAI5525116.1 hypothetical protein TVAGG3_0261090 [Trichomonas vaginalis G3]|eukprot:XP_001326330.1 hypothetical protein [Trichomonas vaginalis G3]